MDAEHELVGDVIYTGQAVEVLSIDYQCRTERGDEYEHDGIYLPRGQRLIIELGHDGTASIRREKIAP